LQVNTARTLAYALLSLLLLASLAACAGLAAGYKPAALGAPEGKMSEGPADELYAEEMAAPAPMAAAADSSVPRSAGSAEAGS